MERYYTDNGVLSKGTSLNILDESKGKFHLLIPTIDMPATKGAPSTQAKTVLTDESVTEVEGLQTNDQKTYSFNYHRDNIRQLKKYKGKQLTFLERNADNTGEKYTGTMQFGRNTVNVDSILQGQIFITVNSASDDTIDDVRDLMMPTAIITTPLPDVVIEGTNTYSINLETSVGATITATSESVSIATAQISGNKLTITGVAKGYTLISLQTSCEGEATSYRTIAVEVTGEEE